MVSCCDSKLQREEKGGGKKQEVLILTQVQGKDEKIRREKKTVEDDYARLPIPKVEEGKKGTCLTIA